jgi:polyferredoxin
LLLRILQQNTSFGGIDPLAPIMNVPTGVVRAQSILFASLSITLFVAFIAVLGKQWILYYTRVTTWGNIVDRGKERQAKLMGLQKWGLHVIMESLPVLLQFALLLFGVALAVYLWDLDVSAAEVVLVVTSIGLTFYICIVVAATVYSDCPFQTPLSTLLRQDPAMGERNSPRVARVWLRRI